jgi:hypothetical protein
MAGDVPTSDVASGVRSGAGQPSSGPRRSTPNPAARVDPWGAASTSEQHSRPTKVLANDATYQEAAHFALWGQKATITNPRECLNQCGTRLDPWHIATLADGCPDPVPGGV